MKKKIIYNILLLIILVLAIISLSLIIEVCTMYWQNLQSAHEQLNEIAYEQHFSRTLQLTFSIIFSFLIIIADITLLVIFNKKPKNC